MKLSFIVPLYNCLPLTQAMLASLQATVPAGTDHEIIFVDDGSTDGTRDWLSTLAPPCRALLNERNLGFAGACNRGAASARGELLFFLNNDLVLLPGWLEPMLAVFREHAEAGLVGNVQLNARTGAVDHAGLRFNAKGKPEHLTRRCWSRAARAVVGVTGACCAIRAQLWRELGGFDAGYVNGAEDVDLALRAAATGRRNYVALASVVRHHVSASAGRKLRDEHNTARLHARWRDPILALIPTACARAIVAAAWENPSAHFRSPLTYDALGHAAGLLPPSPRLRAAAREALDLEAARWAHLLEQAPERAARDVAPSWFPPRDEGGPVY